MRIWGLVVALGTIGAGCAASSGGGKATTSGGGDSVGGSDALETNGPGGGAKASSSSASSAEASTTSGGVDAAGATSTVSSSSSGIPTASSSGSGDGSNCSIMSSNQTCSQCLETYCCKVVHACLDEDLLACTACIDCYLEGKGAACCNEKLGKNAWIEECVSFNCEKECG